VTGGQAPRLWDLNPTIVHNMWVQKGFYGTGWDSWESAWEAPLLGMSGVLGMLGSRLDR